MLLIASVLFGYKVMQKIKERNFQDDGNILEEKKSTNKNGNLQINKKTLVQDEIKSVNNKKTPNLTLRQQKILNVLKGVKIIEMKDLLIAIKGVTERTLRRDLLQLQNENLIKKIGNTKSVKYQLLNN
jgi:hypothetical protein